MSAAESVIAQFHERGHELWLVGGALRDRLLGLGESGDLDYTTSALPDEVEDIGRSLGLNLVSVGKRFGTIGMQVDDRWWEITTFRGDSYEDGDRWPDVTFGASIEEDLARRDFTVNALAEDTRTGRLLDLFGGESDLRARIIRAVGDPATRYREDPLRILRGLRFASQLDFSVEDATLAGMAETADLLLTLSQERVTAELDKLLAGTAPGRALHLLNSTGALAQILPELLPAVGCEQNSFHRFDVWEHTVATVDAIDVSANVRLRRWAALLHDVGKPAVRHVKKNGEWGFYKHETAGAEIASALLSRLKMNHQDAADIVLLIRRHMDRPNVEDDRSVRRFLKKLEERWSDSLALKRADNASHTYNDNDYLSALEQACATIVERDAARLRAESPLDGNELASIFHREPGPWIRQVKDRLSAGVLEGDLEPGDREGALVLAKRILEGE
jgi:poly(A) polymerase